jgi:hypothetical protein
MQVFRPAGPDSTNVSTNVTTVKPEPVDKEDVPSPAKVAGGGTHQPDGTDAVSPGISEVIADQPANSSEDVNMSITPATVSRGDDASTALEAEAKRMRR